MTGNAPEQGSGVTGCGEERYQLFFDKVPVPYQSLNADGRFVDVNEAWLEMMGYARAEVIGHWFGDFITPPGRALFPERFSRFKESGAVNGMEFTLIRKDGSEILVSFDGRVSRDSSGAFSQTHCVFRDITRQKKTEQQLQETLKEETKSREILLSMLEDNNLIRDELEQRLAELKTLQGTLMRAEKFASLGKLASDMAHEVNNPLMIISGYAQLSLLDNRMSGELRGNLAIIHEECNRAKSIIQRLLMFSRPSRGERHPLDINRSVDAMVKLLQHQFRLSNIELKTRLEKNVLSISADEKQLQEVMINLLNNSREAMPQGGTVLITSSLSKGRVKLEIKDSGIGMDDKTMSRLFEPFFTTKEKGTGLGLSVCYGIVQAHNGELKITSKPGRGTTVSIILPAQSTEESDG